MDFDLCLRQSVECGAIGFGDVIAQARSDDPIERYTEECGELIVREQDEPAGADSESAFGHGLYHYAIWLIGSFERVDVVTSRPGNHEGIDSAATQRGQGIFGLFES